MNRLEITGSKRDTPGNFRRHSTNTGNAGRKKSSGEVARPAQNERKSMIPSVPVSHEPAAPEEPPKFTPTFQEGVMGVGPWGMQPVNPLYCATTECAKQLAAILVDLKPDITMLPPNGRISTILGAMVPFLVFPAGFVINAGQLASYWTHGWSQALSEAMCRRDIQSAEEYFAALQR